MSDTISQEPIITDTSVANSVIQQESLWRSFVRQWGLFIIVVGAVLGLDQIAKMMVTERLLLGQSWVPIPQIGWLIRVTHSYNEGAAFGMLPQAADIFLLLAIVTIIAFIISYPRLPSHAWLSRLSIALISGGALSNAIDRVRLGHVIDYVHVQLTPTLSNISNFADHAITLGVAFLLIDQWRNDRKEKQRKEDEATKAVSPEIAEQIEPLSVPASKNSDGDEPSLPETG